jgi:outer membrane protein assembly factor BamB
MISDRRRLVVLTVLVALVAGTAIASRKTSGPSATTQIVGDRLLEKASRANHLKSSTFDRLALTPIDQLSQSSEGTKPTRREFTVYRNALGEIVCREATPDEIKEGQRDLTKLGLRQINHFEFDKSVSGQAVEAANLIIVLRGTQQLQQNATATAAFTRAAQNWENVIKSPVTIYIDVDFGTTAFGQTFPDGVLGATATHSSSYPYQSLRSNLIAQADGEGNATKQGIFNGLPPTTVPTDLGDASGTDVSDSIARAIGLLAPTAQPSDDAAQIAFNSNNDFDFDPGDGITANFIDFDAVATHEIGHALGFESDAGMNLPRPAIWDLYRFRTGTTASTFATAQRIVTVGGSPDPLQYDFIPGNPELGLSNGGPSGSTGNGADGWQSSHWKHVPACGGSIGIMDPAIPDGCRRAITSNDLLALTSFGYNLTNNNSPPPAPPSPTPPANDSFGNAQTITGCSGTTGGSTFGATSEAGEPSHDPPDSTSLSPGHTIWYQWQAPFSTATTITTVGSDFDTIVAVYTGSSVSSLTRLAFNDDQVNGVVRTSNLTFNPTAGTIYKIAVDGWSRDAGTVKLNWAGCQAPSPSPTPTPTVSPAPIASPTPPTGQAVAFQINPAHTGSQMDGLTPPLMPRWSRNMGGTLSYALIVGGRVFVMVRSQTTGLNQLRALDETTGADLWTVDLPNNVIWNGPAYDSGRVFVARVNGLVEAVDAASGTVAWTRQLTGNSGVNLPPVATGGTLFVQAGGVGGTIYALAAADGAVKWTANTSNSGPTSPAVSSTALYASFACGRVHAFSPATGAQFWLRTSTCSGGGGTTPVLTGGRLYSRDNVLGNVILDAGNATTLGSFSGFQIPAFDTSTGYYLNGSALEARDISSGALKWSFSGDGTLSTAPIVDNAYVYIGAQSGKLYALNAATGANVWTGNVGAPMIGSDTIGLAAGEGILVVPAAPLLVAYQHAPLIDTPDFFVKQHYLDFLSRQPDQSGWDFWTNQITSCGSNAQCIEVRRVDVSASFFLSIEFQQTGYLVERFYKVAYGNATGSSTFGGAHQLPVPVVRFNEFLQDTQRIGQGVIVLAPGWEQLLESNKQAYALEFVQTARFTAANAFPTTMTPTVFVDRLNQNAGNVLSASERTAAISLFGGSADTSNTTARAQAVRQVAEDTDLSNAEYNRAFVLAEYFGYLRRNPNDAPETTLDYTGYDFWLTKLNQFNGNYINAEMVKAFLSSIEYRQRFGP